MTVFALNYDYPLTTFTLTPRRAPRLPRDPRGATLSRPDLRRIVAEMID